MTNHKTVARELRVRTAELLIAHACAPQPVVAGANHGTAALMSRGLIRVAGLNEPLELRHHTVVTDDGRQVAAILLADYADALVQAGNLDSASEEVLRQAAAAPLTRR